jgi:hypothetical protein
MTAVKAHSILAFAHRWLSILEFKYAYRTVFHAFSATGAGDPHFDFHLFSPFFVYAPMIPQTCLPQQSYIFFFLVSPEDERMGGGNAVPGNL